VSRAAEAPAEAAEDGALRSASAAPYGTTAPAIATPTRTARASRGSGAPPPMRRTERAWANAASAMIASMSAPQTRPSRSRVASPPSKARTPANGATAAAASADATTAAAAARAWAREGTSTTRTTSATAPAASAPREKLRYTPSPSGAAAAAAAVRSGAARVRSPAIRATRTSPTAASAPVAFQ
jgi:hypothetical protein